MKIAHLILAHKNPKQLARLVNRLAHPEADVYIHLDAKAKQTDFSALFEQPNVYAIKKRVKVYWGGYSIVQATLNSLEQILSTPNHYQYINLLSGDDYPIKNAQQIHRFLVDNPDKIFMEYVTENSEWWTSVKTRVTQYHLTDYRFTGSNLLQRILNNFTGQRRLPADIQFAGRSQWFTITEEAARYVINYVHTHPHIVNFFKLTWGADEVMIQTILYNSHLSIKIENNNLRYIDWPANSPSPRTLSLGDVETLLRSPALYARKFDMKTAPEVLDHLDAVFASNA